MSAVWRASCVHLRVWLKGTLLGLSTIPRWGCWHGDIIIPPPLDLWVAGVGHTAWRRCIHHWMWYEGGLCCSSGLQVSRTTTENGYSFDWWPLRCKCVVLSSLFFTVSLFHRLRGTHLLKRCLKSRANSRYDMCLATLDCHYTLLGFCWWGSKVERQGKARQNLWGGFRGQADTRNP